MTKPAPPTSVQHGPRSVIKHRVFSTVVSFFIFFVCVAIIWNNFAFVVVSSLVLTVVWYALMAKRGWRK